jgi:hypothetical protein
LNTTTDLFRTDLTAATYQGPKLKTFTDSLTGTSYLNEYLAGGRLTKARATPTGSVGALTQDWEENFAFNGVGNIDSVQSLRNLFAATTPRPRQTVTEDYTPVSEAAGVVLDKLANIKRSAVDGAGNPVSLPGTGIERFAYDLLGHLTEVSPPAGLGPLSTGITGARGLRSASVTAENWRGRAREGRLHRQASETGDPAATGSPRGVEPLVSEEMMRKPPPAVEFPLATGSGAPTPPLPPMPEALRAVPPVRAAGPPLLRRGLRGGGAREERPLRAPPLP